MGGELCADKLTSHDRGAGLPRLACGVTRATGRADGGYPGT